MKSSKILFSFVIILSLLSAAPLKIGLAAGADAYVSPSPAGGNGWLLLDLRWGNDQKKIKQRFFYNTDTLAWFLAKQTGKWSFGVQAVGEAFYAGLLPVYYSNGTKIIGNGFNANYVWGALGIKRDLKHAQFISLESGVRQWIFKSTADTSSNFKLPDNPAVLETSLSYLFWRLKSNPSWSDNFRQMPRSSGFLFSAVVSHHLRSSAENWGSVPKRNRPDKNIFLIRQNLRLGTSDKRRLRFEFLQNLSWDFGGDDLTRSRAGGMNPYVTPIAGMPWASVLSSSMAASQAVLRVKVGGVSEIGVLADTAVVQDPGRVGSSKWGVLPGVGILCDSQWKNQQLDVRLGFAPDTGYQDKIPHISFVLIYGIRLK